MLTREQILRGENLRNDQCRLIHETWSARSQNVSAREAWEQACDAFHHTVTAADYLWADQTRQMVRDGNREAIKDVILFLEVDPWYFRSGYLKERLLEALKRAPLTEYDKARLRQVIMNIAVGKKNRREFRRYCSLAVRVTTPEFEDALEQIARTRSRPDSGKLCYLLDYIKRNRNNL